MKNKALLIIMISIGIACIAASLILNSVTTVVVSKALGVIILLIAIKLIKEKSIINIDQKRS